MSLFTAFDHYNLPLGADGSPYDYLERLRDEAVETNTPIGWSEAYGGFWVVACWEEATETHTNVEAFSNRESTFPSYGTPEGRPIMLAEMDDPPHRKYRKIVTAPSSPRAAAARDDQIRATANDLVDGIIDRGRADVCDATEYLPERVTAVILGLPLEGAPSYRRWVHAMVLNATDPEGAAADLQAMADYWAANVEDRRRSESDDLLTAIVHAEADGERLNDEELLDFFSVLLLRRHRQHGAVPGDHVLAAGVGQGPPQAACPQSRRRAAGGGRVPAGARPGRDLPPRQGAHHLGRRHDGAGPARVPGPSALQPRSAGVRTRICSSRTATPNRHFAGRGVHRCLGLHLVKVEVRIMIQEFLRRIPEFELDPARKPRWRSGQVGAMVEVPIVFPPGGGQPDPA